MDVTKEDVGAGNADAADQSSYEGRMETIQMYLSHTLELRRNRSKVH